MFSYYKLKTFTMRVPHEKALPFYSLAKGLCKAKKPAHPPDICNRWNLSVLLTTAGSGKSSI
jgi:hypothetical protein